MSKIHFQPWIGKNYGKPNYLNKKIMVLGESVYCGEYCSARDGCSVFTIDRVTEYLHNDIYDEQGAYRGWAKTYKKFESALIGRRLAIEERPLVWESIIFYNYFQTALDKARQPLGGKLEYDRATECLRKVLEKYQPEVVIAWGNRLWECLDDKDWTNGPVIEHDGCISYTGFYTIGEKKSSCMSIYHPSSGFSWEGWHKNIKEFIENS